MKLLTYKQVSERFAPPVNTLYNMVAENRIPHVRFGSRFVRFSEAEIERWIQDHRVPTADVTR